MTQECIEGNCNKPATHEGADYGEPVCKAHLEQDGIFIDCTICGKNIYEKLRKEGDMAGQFIPVRTRVFYIGDDHCCWECYEEACRR